MRRWLPTVLILALAISLAPVAAPQPTYSAPGLDNRSVRISTSEAGATDVTFDFQFDITIPGVLGSILFQFCQEDPLPFEPCTGPAGFDISAASLDSQTGETGFIIDPGVTANELLLTRVPVMAGDGTVSYSFSGVANPSNEGSHYVRIITYPTVDGSGPSIEEAGAVFSIVERLGVSVFVPPFLLFCVGITVAGDCSSATGSLIDFGILSENSPRTATSQMAGATNGVGGMSISVIGTTMTSGINTISAINPRAPSSPGSNQFGLNLRDNSNPNVGQNPTGVGTTVPTADYNVVNQFKFADGDVVASSPISTNFNVLTAAYLVNINGNQAPGVYTATLTYVALATF